MLMRNSGRLRAIYHIEEYTVPEEGIEYAITGPLTAYINAATVSSSCQESGSTTHPIVIKTIALGSSL